MTGKREDIQKELNITGSETYKNQVIDFIKSVVCNFYHESEEVYDIKTRRTEMVRIRHTAIYLCSINLKIGPSELSRHFNCNHSSVVHTLKKIRGYIEFDREFKKEIKEIQHIVTHRGKMVGGTMNLDADYYYINLNDTTTLRLPDGGAIAFSEVSKEQIEVIRVILNATELPIKHENTGLYILKNIVKSEEIKG